MTSPLPLDPAPRTATGADPAPEITPARLAALEAALPGHIARVSNQRAAEVPGDDLAAYVALGWLRWAAGRLVVTLAGISVRDREEAHRDDARHRPAAA